MGVNSNFPRNSFWLLANSSTYSSLNLLDGNDSISLQLGLWHCLPNRWKTAAEAAKLRGDRIFDFQVQIWENQQ